MGRGLGGNKMSAKHKIVVDQGSDYNLKLTLSQDSVGLPLTGYNIRGHIRPSIGSSTLSASFVGTVIDDTIGEFLISLPASTTTAMTPGLFYYDIEIYNSPYITRILEGTLLVHPEVTR